MSDANAHISTEEIKQDISDTLYEIRTMQKEIDAFEMLGDKMSRFKADSRRHGIQERKAFVIKLERILELREPTSPRRGEEV